MKQLLSIKNNLISFKEIELSSIDPTLYFYVELWNNDGIERYSEVFVQLLLFLFLLLTT